MQSFFSKVRSSNFFNILVFAVIFAAAGLAGLETFKIDDSLKTVIFQLDYYISIFFISEIVVRIAGESKKIDFFKDPWNAFDFIIVSVSLIPLEGVNNIIIARLLRVFRVLRLVTHVPQFKIIINAFLISIPRVLYVIGLMFIIFYIYAVIGSHNFKDVDPSRWGNLFLSLWTLFQVATLEGWPDIMMVQFLDNSWNWIYFFTFILIIALILMNMIVGVIIDVIVQENETEVQAEKKILQKLERIEKQLKQKT